MKQTTSDLDFTDQAILNIIINTSDAVRAWIKSIGGLVSFLTQTAEIHQDRELLRILLSSEQKPHLLKGKANRLFELKNPQPLVDKEKDEKLKHAMIAMSDNNRWNVKRIRSLEGFTKIKDVEAERSIELKNPQPPSEEEAGKKVKELPVNVPNNSREQHEKNGESSFKTQALQKPLQDVANEMLIELKNPQPLMDDELTINDTKAVELSNMSRGSLENSLRTQHKEGTVDEEVSWKTHREDVKVGNPPTRSDARNNRINDAKCLERNTQNHGQIVSESSLHNSIATNTDAMIRDGINKAVATDKIHMVSSPANAVIATLEGGVDTSDLQLDFIVKHNDLVSKCNVLLTLDLYSPL